MSSPYHQHTNEPCRACPRLTAQHASSDESAQPDSDMVVLPRMRLQHLQQHLHRAYSHHPTRHVKQSLQIIHHLLLIDGEQG